MKKILLMLNILIGLSIMTNSCLEEKVIDEDAPSPPVTGIEGKKYIKVSTGVEATQFPLQQLTNERIGLFVYKNNSKLIDNRQVQLGNGVNEFEYPGDDSTGYAFGYYPYQNGNGVSVIETTYFSFLDSIQNQQVSTNTAVSAMPPELASRLLMVSEKSNDFSFKGETGNLRFRNVFSVFQFRIVKDPGLKDFDNQRIKKFRMYSSYGVDLLNPSLYSMPVAGEYSIDIQKAAENPASLLPNFSKKFYVISGTISNSPAVSSSSGSAIAVWVVTAPFDYFYNKLVFRMETENQDGSIKYTTINTFDYSDIARNTLKSFDVVLKKDNVHTDDLVNDSQVNYPANTYVISNPGTYAISTKTPAGVLKSGSSVTWLWASKQGGGNNFNIEELIGNIEYDPQKDLIKFRAGTQDEVFNKGNVILALRDASSKIVWSWHIWLTDKPQDLQFERTVFMDRNLGALSANAASFIDNNGFVYQWGRKDPFYGGDGSLSDEGTSPFLIADRQTVRFPSFTWSKINGVQSMEYSIQNPMSFICNTNSSADENKTPVDWNSSTGTNRWSDNSKTENDPCPYGYKVPSIENYNVTLRSGYTANMFRRQSNTYWIYEYQSVTNAFLTAGRRQGRSVSREGYGAQLKFSGTSGIQGRLFYWSSTPTGAPWGTDGAYITGSDGSGLKSRDEWADKADACSIRCVKE